jgi:hypothetical protein
MKNMVYETPYGNVLININTKYVGIFLSGGLDSAVILYLIAKSFSENNITTPIQPVTIRRGNPTLLTEYDRVNIYPYADKIINYVRNKFPEVNILDTLKEDANYWWASVHENGRNIGSYTFLQTVLSNYLIWSYTRSNIIENYFNSSYDYLYCEYFGTTKNPPKESSVPQSEESHRDYFTENYVKDCATTINSGYKDYIAYYQPFRNADKRITMWLANQFDILEDLLPITRSCEGGPIETENFTKECMECWWCLERHWALINYNT